MNSENKSRNLQIFRHQYNSSHKVDKSEKFVFANAIGTFRVYFISKVFRVKKKEDSIRAKYPKVEIDQNYIFGQIVYPKL